MSTFKHTKTLCNKHSNLDGYGDVEVHHDFLLHDALSSLESETTR